MKRLLINSQKIDWDSAQSYYFFNPKHPEAQKLKTLARKMPFFSRHIYLLTSSFSKVCLLSKDSFLLSSKSVNQHLESSFQDKYLVSLPLFHVGGLSILARAFCGGYSLESLKTWSPEKWIEKAKQKKVTLASLVPTQVYDLVKKKYKAPRSLRAVIVGGDALSPFLYQKARSLNWPLLPSYGLTEACSQVATAELRSLNQKSNPQLKILSHVQLKEKSHQLKIKSKALLTGYYDLEKFKFQNPKNSQGWFSLEDFGVKQGDFLKILGRKEEQVKILGEQVNIKKLNEFLAKITFHSSKDYHIVCTPQKRRGQELYLMTNNFNFKEVYHFVKKFNSRVLPYEKLEKVYFIPYFSKSTLSKIKVENLKKQIDLNL